MLCYSKLPTLWGVQSCFPYKTLWLPSFVKALPPSRLFIPSLLLTLHSTFLSACKTTRSSSSIPFRTGLGEQNMLREMILCLAMCWNPTNIPDLHSLSLINIYIYIFLLNNIISIRTIFKIIGFSLILVFIFKFVKKESTKRETHIQGGLFVL